MLMIRNETVRSRSSQRMMNIPSPSRGGTGWGWGFQVKGKELEGILTEDIKDILEKIKKNLAKRFRDNIKCLILYGSWAKGTAKQGSDIDLLAIFAKRDKETRKSVNDIVNNIETERSITVLSTSLEDFQKEKIPLYTAVKKEGKVIYGNTDLSIHPEPPEIKYSEFFKESREFESRKIKIAEELLEKDMGYGITDFCFVASKHALQAALAMKGEGYSSKVAVLLPLARKHLGKEIAEAFRKLFELYTKSEYGMESLTEEEAMHALEHAKEILRVYNQ